MFQIIPTMDADTMGVDPRQKVTCGEAVIAMVLNALGFVDRPLYGYGTVRFIQRGL